MKKEEPRSFTKSILSLVMVLYFIGAAVGTILIAIAAFIDIRLGVPIDSQMFIAYAAYLGAPTGTAIAFYAWKSKCENLLKIHYTNKGKDDKIDEIIEEMATMGGNS